MELDDKTTHPLDILESFKDRDMIDEHAYRALGRYYRRDLISVHLELRLLLWLGASLLSAGFIMFIVEDQRDWLITVTLVVSVAASLWAAHKVPIESVVHSGLVWLGATLLLALRFYVEFAYGWLSGAWSTTALAFAAIYFLMAHLYRNKAVLMMATSALTAWVGMELNESGFIEVSVAEPQTLRFVVYSFIALVAVGWLHRVNFYREFTVSYIYFYENVLLLAATSGFLMNDYHAGYFAVLAVTTAAAFYTSIKAARPAIMIFALFFSYIAVTVFLIDKLELAVIGVSLYFVITGSALGTYLFRQRGAFRE